MAKPIIQVPHGTAKKIARIFNVSTAVVSLSLKGKRNSELSIKIRHTAIHHYKGIEMIPSTFGQNNC